MTTVAYVNPLALTPSVRPARTEPNEEKAATDTQFEICKQTTTLNNKSKKAERIPTNEYKQCIFVCAYAA